MKIMAMYYSVYEVLGLFDISCSSLGGCMRTARRIANWVLSSGLSALDALPPEMGDRIVRSISGTLSPFQFALLQATNSNTILNGLRLLAEAILQTPYGEPLRYPAPFLITLGTSSYCPHSCVN